MLVKLWLLYHRGSYFLVHLMIYLLAKKPREDGDARWIKQCAPYSVIGVQKWIELDGAEM